MDRIEQVREVVDGILLKIRNEEDKRCAYVHLYGVSQACALLALKRNENVELAIIAGMLHDIYTYTKNDPIDHAHKGAKTARDILDKLLVFSEEEKDLICTAIYNHSDKDRIHGWLDEILKDADVMQNVLYNPIYILKKREPERFRALRDELRIEI